MGEVRHERIDVGGLSLHVASEGEGTPVLLLHGFPEFWYSWRKQMPALAAAGYRAIAPDLRGFNESDRPEGVAQYRLDKLAADIAGLARAVAPGGKVHVVGHDWGGGIAWEVAQRYPELVDKLVILNAPHSAVLQRALLRHPGRALRVWHFFAFQLPWLPERLILRDDFLPRALRGLSRRKQAFSDEDLALYAAALRKPGAATALINYYRAMRYAVTMKAPPQIKSPTMIIWGMKDTVLWPELLDGTDQHVSGPLRIERLDNASHWVQHDEPERVNQLLIEFFQPTAPV